MFWFSNYQVGSPSHIFMKSVFLTHRCKEANLTTCLPMSRSRFSIRLLSSQQVNHIANGKECKRHQADRRQSAVPARGLEPS